MSETKAETEISPKPVKFSKLLQFLKALTFLLKSVLFLSVMAFAALPLAFLAFLTGKSQEND